MTKIAVETAQRQYQEACAQLGDAYAQREVVNKKIAALEARRDVLQALAPVFAGIDRDYATAPEGKEPDGG